MFLTHPLSLPRSLPLEDVAGPGSFSKAEHLAVDVADSGDVYVLTWCRQLSAGYTNALKAQILSRYRPDGELAGALVLERAVGKSNEERGSGIAERLSDLCVLPDGTVAVSTRGGWTYLIDAELKGLIAAGSEGQEADGKGHPRRAFAVATRVTPGGRLLCLLPDAPNEQSHLAPEPRPNLIGLAEGALAAEQRPTVRVLRALTVPTDGYRAEEWVSDTDHAWLLPYTEYRGAPAGPGNRPAPGLMYEVEQRLRKRTHFLSARPYRPHTEAFRVVSEDRFVVPLFESFKPNRLTDYVYALLDETGALIGELESPGTGDTSPVPEDHHAIAADPARGRTTTSTARACTCGTPTENCSPCCPPPTRPTAA